MNKRILPCILLAGFLLGIHEGRVALWNDHDPRPVQIYDIRADSLPPFERLQLQRGIGAQTREQVWELLENYLP